MKLLINKKSKWKITEKDGEVAFCLNFFILHCHFDF